MVQVGGEPNVRADQHALADGMAVEVDQPPRLARPRPLRRASACSAAFCRSASTTRRSTGRAGSGSTCSSGPIRIMAGLGKLKPGAPHKYYDKAYLFADVLVIGGGPAGLEAAIAAAEAGADTLLIDECAAARRLAALRPRSAAIAPASSRGATSSCAARRRDAQPAHHDRHDGHRPVRRQLGVGACAATASTRSAASRR